jgi:hypothetical protein
VEKTKPDDFDAAEEDVLTELSLTVSDVCTSVDALELTVTSLNRLVRSIVQSVLFLLGAVLFAMLMAVLFP